MTDFTSSVSGALGIGWPFMLIQYLIVCGEYFYAKRRRRSPLPRGKLDALIITQLLSPALYLIIYPVMPGSSLIASSWFQVSSKASATFLVTLILCAVITFFSFCTVIQFGEKK